MATKNPHISLYTSKMHPDEETWTYTPRPSLSVGSFLNDVSNSRLTIRRDVILLFGMQTHGLFPFRYHPTSGMQTRDQALFYHHPTLVLQTHNLASFHHHNTPGLQTHDVTSFLHHPTLGVQTHGLALYLYHPTLGLQAHDQIHSIIIPPIQQKTILTRT